jgi:predicted metalloprotease with PDZ domain
MSSSVVVETKTKPTPTSKVGVEFSTMGDKLILRTVSEAGLFGDSALRPGQEVLSINGSPANGMSSSEAVEILASSTDKVTIRAGRGEDSCILKCKMVYFGTTLFDNFQPEHMFAWCEKQCGSSSELKHC